MVPAALRIINRPDEIEARLVPGHWEGDLIKGTFNRSSVGTLAERKTRFVVLCKMSGNGASGVCQRSCPPISCGVSDFRGADFGFWVEPDGSSRLPVAGLT